MLDTDPTATVDDLEHDLADLDEVELPLEQHPNGGSATTTDDEAATAISVALAPPVEEPTEVGDLDAVALDGLGAYPLPAPPLPFLQRKIYGRYRSTGAPYQVELRVDVDGPSLTMRMSADKRSPADRHGLRSMRVDAPAVAITASHVPAQSDPALEGYIVRAGARSQPRWQRRSNDRSGTPGAGSGRSPADSTWEAWDVATLRIDLQGGFDRDTVEIWVDEERRWRGETVTTKFTLDLAASVPLEVPDGAADVRVTLPERGIEQVLEALVAGETYIVVRVENDRLESSSWRRRLLPLGRQSGRPASYPRTHAPADRQQRSRRRDRLRVALSSDRIEKRRSPRSGGAPTMNRRSSSSWRFESCSAVPGWTTSTLPDASSCSSTAPSSPMWIVNVPVITTKTSSWTGSMWRRPTAPGG